MDLMVSPLPAHEVLARLDPHDRAAVETFRDRVREELGPKLRDLRLFGSKARGDDHPESDIDVLVLVDGLDNATSRRVHDIASEIRPLVLPMVRDFDRYHAPISRASGFYEEMRRESVRL